MATRKYEQRLRAEGGGGDPPAHPRRGLSAAARGAHPTGERRPDRAHGPGGPLHRLPDLRLAGGLFDAVIEDLMQRAGFDRVTTAVALPDAREHLRQGIRAGAEVYAVDRDVHRILFSMAMIDPEVEAGAMQRMEERRSAGMAYLARRLAEQDVLRPDLSAADAADMLFVMTSFDAFDLLYTGRGLPVDEVGRLLAATAERAVCR
jgi:hypothetical protein